MAFEKVGDILRDAYKNKYGIAAFNIFNYETIKFAIDAAEAAGKPVLIQLYPGFIKYISFEVTAAITKDLAAKVKTPVGLHLDHCGDVDMIVAAMKAGYPSVMYDGSALPFEENIKITKQVMTEAKKFGADVEAELGSIGNADNAADYTDSAKFTSPDDAAQFVAETGVGSLAIAVGNAHGNYSVLPNLDFARISEISEKVKIPLVLHGGSGIPDDQLKKAVSCGIAKTNVATEYFTAFYKGVSSYVSAGKRKDITACMRTSQEEIGQFLTKKMEVLYG